jgi:hypothetical protein
MRATASGLTQNGSVVWFVCTADDANGIRRLKTQQAIAKADAGGVNAFSVNAQRLRRSLWVVADLVTGDVSVASPERPRQRSGIFVTGNPQSGIKKIDAAVEYLEVLLVRPGDGAWVTSLMDGGLGDDDRARDGRLRLDFDDLYPIAPGTDELPKNLRKSDIVILVEPSSLAIQVIRVRE